VTTEPAALLVPPGPALLARLAAAGEATPGLALAERLRREYPADLVAAAMAQQELRRAAAAKFSRAAAMLFTRAGYEQASSETVAAYRAGRLAGATRVADLCCGIGGDLIALAATATVLAVDRDEGHARLALHNAAVYGRAGRVTALVADVRDLLLAGRGLDAVFIDPARRAGPGHASAGPGGSTAGTARRFRPGQSEPALDWCAGLASQVPAVCVKAAPGIPDEFIPPGWEAEFIAEARDLKEAVLWSPALATAPAAAGAGRRRATVLLPGRGAVSLTARPGDPVPLRQPGEYLLDPNPAVTRATLVEDLARELGGAAKIDPQIAFLTLDRAVTTPFARTLRVLESAPWNERQFARRLRELDIGAVDIRRRGLAGDVEAIRRRLKLAGRHRATVVITRVSDKPWGLICTDPDRVFLRCLLQHHRDRVGAGRDGDRAGALAHRSGRGRRDVAGEGGEVELHRTGRRPAHPQRHRQAVGADPHADPPAVGHRDVAGRDRPAGAEPVAGHPAPDDDRSVAALGDQRVDQAEVTHGDAPGVGRRAAAGRRVVARPRRCRAG
jgi:predicted RNA methylase